MTYKCMLVLALASAARATDGGGIAAPISGFVLDGRANSIRVIEGLPGAARLGASLRLPFAVSAAAIASGRDYALVVSASGAAAPLLARGLRSGAPETSPIDGAIEPTSMAIAASGDAAVLHSAVSRRLQFIVGLPASPRALAPIDASAVDAVAIALDAAGAVALVGAADGQLWRVSRNAPSLDPIARLRGVSSISFLPGRDAAVAAGAETGEIVLLEGLSGAISIRSAAAIPGVRAVQALDLRSAAAITRDGRLASIEFETGAVEWIPLAAEAEMFDSLDRSMFVLNRAGDRPLVLLDAARGRTAWFVPPEPARSSAVGAPAVRGEDRP
jgi:hypothetical protein